MKLRINTANFSLMATILVCIAIYTATGIHFTGFFSIAVLRDILTDNSFLGITSIGLTFVILTSGIDLSVGAVIAATSVGIAVLVVKYHLPPVLAIAILMTAGTLFGAVMGVLIHYYKLPSFLVTLAGMFMARGLGLVISMEQIPIEHPLFLKVPDIGFHYHGDMILPLITIVYLATVIVSIYIAHFTLFGRTVYAIGGNEDAAVMMGLSVARTKVAVYALSGFCSALAGVVFTFYTSQGNSSAVVGLELDAIAAVVVGGTLLIGGIGYVFGTFVGVMIFGIIQTAITFQGTLNSWWTKIAIAFLLLCFIALQKLLSRIAARRG